MAEGKLVWGAIGLAALAYAAAGAAKLAGVAQMHESFVLLGLPGWFGYFIGACEVAGAIGLFIRPLSALAAMGLAIIMIGALYFHITHPPIAAGIPALILLGLDLFVVKTRGGDLFKFGG